MTDKLSDGDLVSLISILRHAMTRGDVPVDLSPALLGAAKELDAIRALAGSVSMSASARDAVSDWLLDRDISFARGSTNDLADDLIAALSAAGFAIVPMEPTEEMIQAGEFSPDSHTWGERVGVIYRAMLSAAEGKK